MTKRSAVQGMRNLRRNTINGNTALRAAILNRSGNGSRFSARSMRVANPVFANRSSRNPASRALASATFHGKFSNFHPRRWHPHRHRPIVVIGWVGPLFWPYAYDDFLDYTFWPYAYDTFWPYAYDDVYDGVFGGYAYRSSTSGNYANAPASSSAKTGPGRDTAARGATQAATASHVCTAHTAGLTDWPIERIAAAVEPIEAQKASLDALKDATAKAVGLLQSACPTDLPSTPTGRLAVMSTRLDSMLQAVQAVRPALDAFYNSLTDEQRARFNAIGQDEEQQPPQRAASSQLQKDELTRTCSGQAAGANLPIDRMRQVLRPNDEQSVALDELKSASEHAAEGMKATCSADESLTPTGRIAAMEKRLTAMSSALNIVRPALEKFYSLLSDEQKARFNQMSYPRQS